MSNHQFSVEESYDTRLGLMTSYRFEHDPKTVLFMMARYKFVAKMLTGYGSVLEVGCADAFGSRLVRQAVGKLTALDIDSSMIEDAKKRVSTKWDVLYVMGDMAAAPEKRYDALYCLDVLEHVLPSEEGIFLSCAAQLAPVAVIGMPSLESQAYASPFSRDNHVNCKTEAGLKDSLQKHYRNVFLFGMNDEVLTTGFGPMCHYRLALCVK